MPDQGRPTRWTTCACGCGKTIRAAHPNYYERWNEVELWIARECHELKQNRQTRNSFVDSDEIQDTIERGFWSD
jgi:hypothetical protein